MATGARYRLSVSGKSFVWLLVLALALFVAQSGAQTFPGIYPSDGMSSLSEGLFQNLGFAGVGSDLGSTQCHVRVIANDVVVSATEWHEVAHHVLPPGVVENPDQWPFFAWSDTPLGVARARDGKGYLFFGSDGATIPLTAI